MIAARKGKPEAMHAIVLLALVLAVAGAAQEAPPLGGEVTTKDVLAYNNNKTAAAAAAAIRVVEQQMATGNETAAATAEQLETAPTITSVHQVWTSSSSGRLDELSPEMISKLRGQDVPFLAAYALRPRLVGAAAVAVAPTVAPAISASAGSSSSKQLALVAAASGSAPLVTSGRQRALPADFSEYNEETSSLSKSEHHHRRKTSVKRRAQPGPDEDAAAAAGGDGDGDGDGPMDFSSSSLRRRRVSSSSADDSLGQLVKRLRQRRQQGVVANKKGGKGAKFAAGKSTRRRTAGNASSGRRRSRSSKARKRSRGSAKPQRLATKSRRSGRLQAVQDSKVNSDGGGGDVKGGGPSPKRTPFYASNRPVAADADEADHNPTEGAAKGPASPRTSSEGSVDDNKLDHGQEGAAAADEPEIDEEPRQEEPKRVGDGDVDEAQGDTVLVEPKSDGVDDDPPLPDENEDEDGAAEAAPDDDQLDGNEKTGVPRDDPADEREDVPRGETEERAGMGTGTGPTAPVGDPRGTRVNRQKPNQPPASELEGSRSGQQDGDDSAADGSGGAGGGGGGSQVAGGGIGTTLGGGPSGDSSGSNTADSATGDTDLAGDGRTMSGDDDDSTNDRRRGPNGAASPGVEFADEGGERTSTEGSTGGDSSGGTSSQDGNGQFGERRPGQAAGSSAQGGRGAAAGTSGGTSNQDDDKDDDLDYRDEMAAGAERRPASGKGPQAATGGGSGPELPTSSERGSAHKPDGSARDGHAPAKDHHSQGQGQHCDDGSYSHEHDHGHGHGHASHHDTIDWLRGAIPGEPDDDYPILSRVNATNFKCSDHKHPGYYADVDARCQIFHICQADGRQDSFLCPNGTIFSQRTLVCVWWNGFDCEDAPKLYHLNELLYKTSNGNESPQAAARGDSNGAAGPLGPSLVMTPLRPPKGMRDTAVAPADDDGGDDTSPIDGLVRAMRGRGESTSPRDATGQTIGSGSANGGGPAGELPDRAVGREAGVSRGRSGAGAGSNLGPEDEPTIQRKSTNLDEEDSLDEQPPARLRARNNTPRRRRRASTRQAPPKLKSRRVSRNSRRRKLRHGVKPRRRA